MKRALLCLLVIFLSACSDPKSTVIPVDPDKWETSLKEPAAKLPEEEKRMLAAWIIRSKAKELFGGEKMKDGTTIGQAIDEQRKFEEKQKEKQIEEEALRNEIEKRKADLKEKIHNALTVTVLDIWNSKEGYQEYQNVSLGIQNNSERDINGLMGMLVFTDMFGQDIGKLRIKYEEGVPAGQIITWNGSREYNQFLADHKEIAKLRKGKYTVRFDPESIIFADGEKLGID
ncbi:hypothetical protein NB644_09475 [Oxalobacter formigenes]|uniref:hypothetical protein n=1 Tax=Oxalobacter formigenes TaxID=847 RepID=UPI0022B01F4C|nr:hypothetical protein [Oxalobacter formigenes]WAW01165.1 hypothetical protein NB644_09475 [Oxalobacter formigenes]WAW03493.1 hypothetical protein NB642_10245 [Oxalobacter formigenes]